MSADELRKRVREHFAAGQLLEGWQLLRRQVSTPAAEAERLGALIAKWTTSLKKVVPHVERVAVLGQCNTTWLGNAVRAVAAGDGTLAEVYDGEYDNIVAELAGPNLAGFQATTILLVPWHRSLFRPGADDTDSRIAQELAFWEEVWRQAGRLGTRVVQIGYDWVHPGPLGFHLDGGPDGQVGRVRRMNEQLRARLPSGSYFIDLPLVSGEVGRRAMYDLRGYYWTKSPFSLEGNSWLAQHVWAGVRALKTGPKKVAVLDLDNTLWGGVVGELGPLEVALGESADGEAFRAFQRYLLGLAERGSLLAVASKNNEQDAREPFQSNPSMVLRMDQMSAFEAHWEPKSISLGRIADRLRLGLDALVFLDDSPAEREQVRAALPDVAVPELGDEPAEYTRRLSSSLLFESAAITDADRVRVEQYRVEQLRDATQRSFDTFDAYLRSLELRGDAFAIAESDMLRVSQLVSKTNQFNLTTRRHSREELDRIRTTPGSICLGLRLVDRFGEYGLIGLLLAIPAGPNRLELDTWLMSCRALSRTAEQFLFGELLIRARANGIESLTGSYVPTPKNSQVAELLPNLGFSRLREDPDGARHFELSLAQAASPKTLVESGRPGSV